MKSNKSILLVLFLFINLFVHSQNDINQNGLKTTVITNLYTNDSQAKRYEIASIGFNSFHWQAGGLVIVELFQTSYGTGYEKYVIENGYSQGVNYGSPALKLVESHGTYHSGKIILGQAIDLTTSLGDKINRKLPVYFDVRDYATYRIRLTYLQEKVDTVTNINQIYINQSPVAINIPDFSVSDALNTNLRLIGNGNHYIQNGSLGIGTTATGSHKLAVEGSIGAREIKVMASGWSDFVFKKDYALPTLEEVEKHIAAKGHLENIPSEEEVLKNGINLGEMNAKLLQKIEELTLYIIEQNKEIEDLKCQNQNFKVVFDRLSKIEEKLN